MKLGREMFAQNKITLGAIVLIVIIVLVLFVDFVDHEITIPIKSQSKALAANDLATAYSFNTTDFQNANSIPTFEEFVNRHPELKNNTGLSIVDKEIKGDTGIVKANLRSTDGNTIPVEYHLLIEDGDWRINEIIINNDSISDNAGLDDETQLAATNKMQQYDNKDSRYLINYPTNWEIDASEQGTVIFSGAKDSPSFYSNVNIQSVLTKNRGGEYSTTKEFMADILRQARAQSPDVKILEQNLIDLKDTNGSVLKGEYDIFSYKIKNITFKQWQIVVLRDDSQVFYAWAYISPVNQYDADLATAKAMLASWKIY